MQFLMKKILTLALAVLMVLGLGACAIADENTGMPVFDTDNIVGITLYSYYGHGGGAEVPEENLEEFIAWLATFKVGSKMYSDTVPDDANTIFVEIFYEDGTVLKKGIEAIVIDGYGYYLEYGKTPDFFNDLLNQTSLIEQ